MKQVFGAYLISGGGLADLRGGLAPAAPPPRGYGPGVKYIYFTTTNIYIVYYTYQN